MDGHVDGIIAYPELCEFDPQALLGSTIDCPDTGSTQSICAAAVAVAEASWTGAKGPNDELLWYLPGYGSNLTSQLSLAQTICEGESCVGKPYQNLVAQFVFCTRFCIAYVLLTSPKGSYTPGFPYS